MGLGLLHVSCLLGAKIVAGLQFFTAEDEGWVDGGEGLAVASGFETVGGGLDNFDVAGLDVGEAFGDGVEAVEGGGGGDYPAPRFELLPNPLQGEFGGAAAFHTDPVGMVG